MIQKLAKGMLRAGLVLLGAMVLTGCLSAPSKKVKFQIATTAESNNGRPLHVLVREVTRKDFLVDYYDDIADGIYGGKQDESLLGWRVILPGEKTLITVERPEKKDLAVYGMFTNPGNNWKVLVTEKEEKRHRIVVDRNELKKGKTGGGLLGGSDDS